MQLQQVLMLVLVLLVLQWVEGDSLIGKDGGAEIG